MKKKGASLFTDLAISKNYKINKPSFIERQGNVDLVLIGQENGLDKKVLIDIKKKNKKDSNNWVYIEFQNSKGGDGWINGLSDFIVFETSQSFIFCPRKKLLNYLNSSNIIRWDLPYVDKPWNSKYRLFRRPQTLEIITQIKVQDILSLGNIQIWHKS